QFLAPDTNQIYPFYGDDPRRPGTKSVFSAARIFFLGKPGYVYVILHGTILRNLDRLFGQYATLSGITAQLSISVVIAWAIGLLAFSMLTQRFRRLTSAVHSFERGDFRERLPVRSEDEVDQLARAVNQMADTIVANIKQLERRDELRRELIANVSHDL